jgi:hypothetical protein
VRVEEHVLHVGLAYGVQPRAFPGVYAVEDDAPVAFPVRDAQDGLVVHERHVERHAVRHIRSRNLPRAKRRRCSHGARTRLGGCPNAGPINRHDELPEIVRESNAMRDGATATDLDRADPLDRIERPGTAVLDRVLG